MAHRALEAIRGPGFRFVSRQDHLQGDDEHVNARSSAQRPSPHRLASEAGHSAFDEQGSWRTRSNVSNSPGAGHPFLRWQRQYGNRYVQRVVALALSREHDSSVPPDVERALESTRGGGQSLDSGIQAHMGQALDADFSGVRVHTNANADALNQSLSARAFTTGRDIYFRHGEYNPGSSRGRELLAHELTHVVQQNPDRILTKSDDGSQQGCHCGSTSAADPEMSDEIR